MPRTQNRSDLDVNKSQITARTSLYSDFDLAFKPHPNTGDITTLYDINAVKQSVKNLVLTNRGERPFAPNLGCDITGLLFEPADGFTAVSIKEAITLTLDTYEPRVNLKNIIVTAEPDNNRYAVEIEFQIKTNLQTGSLEFYLERIR